MGNAPLVRALLFLGGTLALAGCGGGGGGGSNVSFAFQSAALSMNESDAPASVTVALNSLLPSLPTDVSVEVYDLGTGTATSGSDYAAFAPQTVTFAAGSVDDATQVVLLDPLDDALVDAPGETVRLGLRTAVGGVLYGTTQLTVTLADADTAQVAFATAAGTTTEASAAQAVALELECGAGVTLQVDVSVRVSDLHTGTAVSPADYATFAAQTVTFPAGSADGAVQTVMLMLAEDATTEGDETIELGLAQPSAACVLAAPLTHAFTIQDDDLAGNAAFQASQGATGVENGLAYDELIPLGTQVVGAGPNAGTLLRVANLGGQPMDLGTPSLTGTHPNDFALDVESSSLGPPSADGMTSAFPAAAEAVAPLAALASDAGPGVALQVDPTELARLRASSAVTLHGIELPELGVVALELTRRPLPVAPDAKLVIDGAEVAGGPRTLLGDLSLWSGRVAGVEGSRVFLAFRGEEVQGFVRLPQPADGFVHVFPDGAGRVRFVSDLELLALGATLPEEFCAGERFVSGDATALGLVQDPDGPTTSALTMANCRLALETDYEFFQKFGVGGSTALTNYVTSQIAAISDQYATDVQTTLSIAYLGIHTVANDGWDAADAGELLTEFKAAWDNPSDRPLGAAGADLAHFLSGDSLGGGIAYVNQLCSQSFGFAVSGSLYGNINWLTWTGQAASFTWDFVVVAHELGHNFGSSHTHDYCPPLDECSPPAYGWGPCQDEQACERGTIMSYCHIACGGLSNIDLYFHPVTANIMRQRVNASCLGQGMLSPGDYVQYRLRFNPLNPPTGARSATLTFPHDAPNATQPFRIQLSGTAN